MTSSLHLQELDNSDADIREALDNAFGYQLRGLMKNPELLEERDQLLYRFLDLAQDRDADEDYGDLNARDGATALFDCLGHRFPDDCFGDATIGSMLRWTAKWALFSNALPAFCRHFGFKDDQWVHDMLTNYERGLHCT